MSNQCQIDVESSRIDPEGGGEADSRVGSGGPVPKKPLTRTVRLFFLYATIAFGVFPLFLPLAITALGRPGGCFSLAFGAFEFIIPKYFHRLGNMD